MGGGGGVLYINGLMGMCCWMDLHFYDWIDYNVIAFSTEFPTELLELGRKLSGFWWDLKMERFVVKKVVAKRTVAP